MDLQAWYKMLKGAVCEVASISCCVNVVLRSEHEVWQRLGGEVADVGRCEVVLKSEILYVAECHEKEKSACIVLGVLKMVQGYHAHCVVDTDVVCQNINAIAIMHQYCKAGMRELKPFRWAPEAPFHSQPHFSTALPIPVLLSPATAPSHMQ